MYSRRECTGDLRLQRPNELLPQYAHRYVYCQGDAVYILKADMQKQHDSYRLVHRIFNYPPLDQPSRLLVSVDNRRVSVGDPVAEKAVAGKAVAETVDDIAGTADEDVIGEIWKEDLMGGVCQMMNILNTRLTAAIVPV